MITASRIRELLQHKPFRPIRVFLSDGSHHDVPHPEFAWVFGGRLFIGESANGDPDATGRLKEIAVLHVTRVEEIKARKPRR